MRIKVVKEQSTDHLTIQVNALLKEGWELIGGVRVVVMIINKQPVWYATMVKEEDDGS